MQHNYTILEGEIIMARKIEVVDDNPEWEKQFKEEAKKIKAILGKNCVEIHHIGSTSVKGLKAKPVIDIMPVVKDISLVDGQNAQFEALGYECMGEFGIPGRRFYRKGGDNRTHHIHIFQKDNTAQIQRHLAVRDYLRSNKEKAEEYAKLKTKLAEEFTYDNDGYCEGKDAFMKELEQEALAWQEKQNHIGTCMSLGMCFGVAMGSAFGATFGNMSLGMCYGIGIGMCLGLVVGYAKTKK